MDIEIRLKALLRTCRPSQDDHGVFQRIQREVGVDRRCASRLYHNELTNPPLDQLGLICDFLVAHGVPAEKLPQALFGVRPAALWQAVAEKQMVTFHLGEYHRTDGPMPARLSISRRDASVAADLIGRVAILPSAEGGRRPEVHIGYVPFRFSLQTSEVSDEDLLRDANSAREIFRKMRAPHTERASFLVGSQRVNYCTELFVADLFGAKPFTDPGDNSRVPFYIRYREYDRDVRSCFGGFRLPGSDGEEAPGIYYRKRGGAASWEALEWELHSRDAGIVITAYDKRTGAIELALMGFSGRATANIGAKFLHNPHLFWPPRAEAKGRQVGVYLCSIAFPKVGGNEEPPEIGKVEVIALTPKTIHHYMA